MAHTLCYLSTNSYLVISYLFSTGKEVPYSFAQSLSTPSLIQNYIAFIFLSKRVNLSRVEKCLFVLPGGSETSKTSISASPNYFGSFELLSARFSRCCYFKQVRVHCLKEITKIQVWVHAFSPITQDIYRQISMSSNPVSKERLLKNIWESFPIVKEKLKTI